MAKVNIKFNNKKLQAQIIRDIEAVIDSEPLKKEVGLLATDRIRFQARIEKPLNNSKSFPALKALTISTRAYLKKFNRTHKTFNESRANITLTGQFLNSIGFNVIRGGIELLYRGARKPYKTGPNSRAKDTPTKHNWRFF